MKTSDAIEMSHIRRQAYVKHEESPRTAVWRTTEKKSVTQSAKKRWREQLPEEWKQPLPSYVTPEIAPEMMSRLKNAKNKQHNNFFNKANLSPTVKSPRGSWYVPNIKRKADKIRARAIIIPNDVIPKAHRARMNTVVPVNSQLAELQTMQVQYSPKALKVSTVPSVRVYSPLKPLSVPAIKVPSPSVLYSARPSQRQTATIKHTDAIRKAMNLYPKAMNLLPPIVRIKPSMQQVLARRTPHTRRTLLVPKKQNIIFNPVTRKSSKK